MVTITAAASADYLKMAIVQQRSLMRSSYRGSHRIVDLETLEKASWSNKLYKDESTLKFVISNRPQMILEAFETSEYVLFVGADVYFLEDPSSKLKSMLAAQNTEAAIVPHLSAPSAEDRLGQIVTTGLYNSDFILFKRTNKVREFLHWWQRQINTRLEDNRRAGYFLDQTYLDFLPLQVPTSIIPIEEGYNIAYYNLQEYEICRDKVTGDYYNGLNGKSLKAVQFSGYEPYALSKYKFAPELLTYDVASLLAQYRKELENV